MLPIAKADFAYLESVGYDMLSKETAQIKLLRTESVSHLFWAARALGTAQAQQVTSRPAVLRSGSIQVKH